MKNLRTFILTNPDLAKVDLIYLPEACGRLTLVFMNEFSPLGTALDSVLVVTQIHSEFTGRKKGPNFWLK